MFRVTTRKDTAVIEMNAEVLAWLAAYLPHYDEVTKQLWAAFDQLAETRD